MAPITVIGSAPYSFDCIPKEKPIASLYKGVVLATDAVVSYFDKLGALNNPNASPPPSSQSPDNFSISQNKPFIHKGRTFYAQLSLLHRETLTSATIANIQIFDSNKNSLGGSLRTSQTDLIYPVLAYECALQMAFDISSPVIIEFRELYYNSSSISRFWDESKTEAIRSFIQAYTQKELCKTLGFSPAPN